MTYELVFINTKLEMKQTTQIGHANFACELFSKIGFIER